MIEMSAPVSANALIGSAMIPMTILYLFCDGLRFGFEQHIPISFFEYYPGLCTLFTICSAFPVAFASAVSFLAPVVSFMLSTVHDYVI